MECRQLTYLFLGFSAFVSVMYWSSPMYARTRYPPRLKDRANIILVLTDDQDIVLGGTRGMPHLRRVLAAEGVTMNNAFVASPLCCPSRSTILTGQYVHNHRAVNNSLSGQCSGPRWQNGPEKRTFATHLHNHGYKTFFAGKYLNQYGDAAVGGLAHVPPGWDYWLGLMGNSRYYDYVLSFNGVREEHGRNEEDYLTNVIRERGISFLRNESFDRPVFMMLSVPSAHAPFTPENKYATNFSSQKAPRTENFNIANGKDKHWLLRQGVQPLPDDVIEKVDEVYRNRLRTLLTVDDLVNDVVQYLESVDQLKNTYIIFTSDNGYHLGQFSLPLDKREPYETDIRVPLIVRGPDILSGVVSSFPTSNVDLAPTILDLASIPIPKYMDGISLKPELVGRYQNTGKYISPNALKSKSINQNTVQDKPDLQEYRTARRFMLIEHSGEGKETNPGCTDTSGLSGCNPDFACKCEDSYNNTYNCLRQLGHDEDKLFCEWEDDEGFVEAYDLQKDPQQLNNIADSLKKEVRRKLHNLLKKMVSCRGARCWELARFVV